LIEHSTVNFAKEFERNVLNIYCATRVYKNSKFGKECISSLTPLPARNFVTFASQFFTFEIGSSKEQKTIW